MAGTEISILDEQSLENITASCLDIFDGCIDVLRSIDAHWQRLEAFGRLLTAAKSKVPHGEWESWISETFSGRLPIRTAQRWMVTSKATRMALLESSDAPKSERKTDQVKVIEPGQPSVQADKPDPDPSPKPPTNRKSSAATAKPKESSKPQTQPLIPEILEEPKQSDPVAEWIASHSLGEIVERIVSKIEDDKTRKAAAKQLRKMADKLDPPSKFVPPDIEEVAAYFEELESDLPAQHFIDFYAKGGWLISKGKPMKDWRAAARDADLKWDRKNVRHNGMTSTRVRVKKFTKEIKYDD